MFRRLLLTVGAALLASAAAVYVSSRVASAKLAAGPAGQSTIEREKIEGEMLDRQFKEANRRRQEDIRNDTDRLLHLATELKAAADRSDEHTLSLDVVRKADEVEHLAHRVKEKMKEPVGRRPQPAVIRRPPQESLPPHQRVVSVPG